MREASRLKFLCAAFFHRTFPRDIAASNTSHKTRTFPFITKRHHQHNHTNQPNLSRAKSDFPLFLVPSSLPIISTFPFTHRTAHSPSALASINNIQSVVLSQRIFTPKRSHLFAPIFLIIDFLPEFLPDSRNN